jgi:hypothetical protein
LSFAQFEREVTAERIHEALTKVLAEQTTVRVDGEAQKMTNIEAIAHVLRKKAFARNRAAQRLFESLLRESDRQQTEAEMPRFSGVLRVPHGYLEALDGAVAVERARDPSASEAELKDRAWRKIIKDWN